MITSKSNPRIKEIKKLALSAGARRKSGLFITEGARLTCEAPEELVENIYISQDAGSEIKSAYEGNPRVELVSGDVFRSISDTVTPQGVLAVVRQPSWEMKDLAGRLMIVILDDVRDPGNLGTIIRTAEAAGAAVLMSPGCADIFNPKVVRSTMGSIFRVPFVSADILPAIKFLKDQSFCVYAAALEGGLDYSKYVPGEKSAFVIGNEANGVSDPVLEAADERIYIPMEGKVESLNAAVSAAILMFFFKNS